jgi:3-oxoacyl-[acyl-carrier-protein] synthase-3
MGATPSQVGLLGLGAYVPERVMTNDEWASWVDTSDEWIRQRTGIERRRIAAAGESTSDMAVAAARRALADAGLEPADVDEIVVATDTPEVYLPDTSSFVQLRLGARQVPAYTLGGSGCAGFIQALDVACSRVAAGRERVLVIGVELLTRLMNWRDRNTCVLFGDAAAAAVIGRGAGVKPVEACVCGTDGSRADILMLEMGGTRLPFSAEGAARGLHQAIVMKGREVFKEAVARMTEASRAVLTRAGRRLEEVALVVPHQANLRIIDAVGKSLGVGPDRVFVNVQEYGNTGSASVPLALCQARDAGRIAPGDLVLLTSFGAGFHWAAALVRF